MAHALVGNREVKEHFFVVVYTCALSVYEKFYLREVRIDFYLCHLFVAVYISFAGDMDERRLGEPCFIGVECVLAIGAVNTYKAFPVLTLAAALGPVVRAKIKHIPNMCRPQIRPFNDLGDHHFVVERLILLRVIAPARVIGVPVEGVCSVFRKAERFVGVQRVNAVEPCAGIFCIAFIASAVYR